jgi:hypothetical protein
MPPTPTIVIPVSDPREEDIGAEPSAPPTATAPAAADEGWVDVEAAAPGTTAVQVDDKGKAPMDLETATSEEPSKEKEL